MIPQQASRNDAVGALKGGDCRRIAGICLVLAIITFAVFGQTLRHDFIDFDDDDYVYENPVVARGLTFKGLVWAFTRSHAANWHPLTWLSHMLDCQLYGLHPGGHHLTNVLLHVATVILLFLLLRRLTGALWRGAFVAAVFAIHPLRVESVAWVAERKDVLSGLFFMLTIGAYVGYARRPWSLVRYGLVALLFAMGLMCKPMLVSLPLVLLLLDYWPLRRAESARRLVMEKLPLLAISVAVCVVTLMTQHASARSTVSFSLALRMANALVSCMVYLGQMMCPRGLAVLYPYPRDGFPAWEVAAAGTLLASLSAIAWWQRRKQPWIWIGWLWYLVMLLPVIGIIHVGPQAHADRFTYLPQIGIYAAITWLVAEWAAKLHASRAAVAVLATATLGVLFICTWKQTGYWKNSETLWNHALECTTGNYVAYNNLGVILDHQGKVDEAITQYQSALQINPGFSEAHANLGIAFRHKGNDDEAITQYQTALQLNPGYALARNSLGNSLRRKGKEDEAMIQYQMALQINPGYAEAHKNLASLLLQKGKVDEAIARYQMALQINPDDAEAHNSLGIILLQKGKVDDAIAHYQIALQINPDFAQGNFDLGAALLQKGETVEALARFQKAVQLAPDDPRSLDSMAWLLATLPQASLRNGDKAVQLSQRANHLTGGKNPALLRTLAAAFAEAGEFTEAKRIVQQAIDLFQAAGRHDLAEQLKGELKRYEAGLPLHQ
jgi:tetratricopeptide (TPR) repeat protein